MVTLELCRHPESAAQVASVEAYSAALGVGGPHLEIARDWIDEGIERATDDFDRFYGENLSTLSEPSLRDRYLRLDEPDLELGAPARSAARPARGHPRLGVHRVLPAQRHHRARRRHAHARALREPRHEPRDQRLRADRSRRDRARRVHAGDERQRRELAPVRRQPRDPRSRSADARRDRAQGEHVDPPGATDLLGEAFERGARCTSDFSQADHLSMADWPLDDVRAYYNVVPRVNPMV